MNTQLSALRAIVTLTNTILDSKYLKPPWATPLVWIWAIALKETRRDQ